jgi:hypothetical protein
VFTALAYTAHSAVTHSSTPSAGSTGSPRDNSKHAPAQQQQQQQQSSNIGQEGELASGDTDTGTFKPTSQADSAGKGTQVAPVSTGSDKICKQVSQQGGTGPHDTSATLASSCAATAQQQQLPTGPATYR